MLVAIFIAGGVVQVADITFCRGSCDDTSTSPQSASSVSVPDVTGTPIGAANRAVRATGLTPRVHDSGVFGRLPFGPAPLVAGQTPSAGTSVATGSRVTLYVK